MKNNNKTKKKGTSLVLTLDVVQCVLPQEIMSTGMQAFSAKILYTQNHASVAEWHGHC